MSEQGYSQRIPSAPDMEEEPSDAWLPPNRFDMTTDQTPGVEGVGQQLNYSTLQQNEGESFPSSSPVLSSDFSNSACCVRIPTEEVEEQHSDGAPHQNQLNSALVDCVKADFGKVSITHTSIAAAADGKPGTCVGGEHLGCPSSPSLLSSDLSNSACCVRMPTVQVEGRHNDGTPNQNQLISALVDCVKTNFGEVSIAHASSNVAADGDAGSREGGEHEGGEETKTEPMLMSGNNIGGEPLHANLEQQGMVCENGGSEKSREAARTEKDVLQQSENSSESDDSSDQSSSNTDDEEEEGSSESSSSTDDDDEDSSSFSSEAEADGNQKDDAEVEDEFEEGELKQTPGPETNRKQTRVAKDDLSSDDGGSKDAVRSKNELRDSPPVPLVTVILEQHHKTCPAGVISSVVGICVVVEGIEGQQALNEGSILWLTEHRLPLGIVDELFGPVKKPFYVVRFNDASELPGGLKEGVHVSYVREFSEFVLNDPNLHKKGYDASGENDEEISEKELDFSDDEKEAEYKQTKARMKRGIQDSDKLFQGSRRPNSRKQGRQARQLSNTNSRHQENEIAHKPEIEQQLQPQCHLGQRRSRIRTGPESMQAFPVSTKTVDRPLKHQLPIVQQTSLQHSSSSIHPQLIGQGNQFHHSFGAPLSVQKPLCPGLESMQAMHRSLQQSESLQIQQFPLSQQAHLQQFSHLQQPGQVTQVAPGISLSHQPLGNMVSTSSIHTGLQAPAVGSPVLGIPAGTVSTPFNCSLQAPSGSMLPTISQYRGNITFQGPGLSAWDSANQMQHALPNIGSRVFPLPQLTPPQQSGIPVFPLQQQTSQQSWQFSDPWRTAHP